MYSIEKVFLIHKVNVRENYFECGVLGMLFLLQFLHFTCYYSQSSVDYSILETVVSGGISEKLLRIPTIFIYTC